MSLGGRARRHGAVTWWSAITDRLRLGDGLSTGHVAYYFAGGHVCPMDPGTELPISRVYDLIRECERPARVEWVELPV